jgi:DNA-binding SARP family transcriptional activator
MEQQDNLPAELRFRVLGPLEIWAGGAWASVGAPKTRALLAALLADAGQVVPTYRLIDEIWGDTPPAGAVNLVSIYVHKLRKMLGDDGDLLLHRPPGYMLNVRPGEVDAFWFTALVSEGRQALTLQQHGQAAELLAEALGLWRGRPYMDVPASVLVNAEEMRLEEARLEALELSFTAAIGCGRAAEIIPELTRLTTDHPLNEKLWVLLMRALHESGRRAEALAAYGRAREVFDAELGVPPGTALRAVNEDILTSDMRPPHDQNILSAPAGLLALASLAAARLEGEADPGGGPPVPVPAIRDAAGYRLEPDPLEARTPAEFVKALKDFRTWAADGLSLRDMARLSGGTVSYSAICKALGRDQLPSYKVVVAVITACGGTAEQLQAYVTARRMIQMAQQAATAPPRPGLGASIPPARQA